MVAGGIGLSQRIKVPPELRGRIDLGDTHHVRHVRDDACVPLVATCNRGLPHRRIRRERAADVASRDPHRRAIERGL